MASLSPRTITMPRQRPGAYSGAQQRLRLHLRAHRTAAVRGRRLDDEQSHRRGDSEADAPRNDQPSSPVGDGLAVHDLSSKS